MELFESSSPWIQALGTLLIGLVIATVVAAVVNLLARKLLQDTSDAGKVGGATFWIVAVVSIAVALGQLTTGDATELGLTAATTRLLAGLPNLLVALLVGVMGWLLAVTVRGALRRVLARFQPVAAEILAPLAFWAVLILAGIVAADQIGIEVLFLEWLIGLVVGGIILAAALAVGLGSRDLVGQVVAGRHVERIVDIGDEVEVAGVLGTVIGLGHASARLATAGGEVELPNQRFLEGPVLITRRAGQA